MVDDLSVFSGSLDQKVERIKLSSVLSTEAYNIGFDFFNSVNLRIYKISKANYLPSYFRFLKNEYIIRNSLAENVSYIEYFDNGDYCPEAGINRKTIVEYRCDPEGLSEANIYKVTEDATCVYRYYVKSYFLCNPKFLSNKKQENVPLEIKCGLF